MMRPVMLALLLAACGSEPRVHVHADGASLAIDGDVALRAVHVKLQWTPCASFTAAAAGPDAAQLNMVRLQLDPDGCGGQVVVTDTRRIRLPARGSIVAFTAASDTVIRVLSAQGADEQEAGSPYAVDVGVK